MILDQACYNTSIIFPSQYSRKSRLFYELKIFIHISISCIYLGKSLYVYLYPHEKINRCLTDIKRCLTDIFKI